MQQGVAHRKELALIERALDALRRQTGLTGRILQLEPKRTIADGTTRYRPDALIEIQVRDRKLKFFAEVKLIDRFEMVTQVRTFWPLHARPPILLVAPYITAEMTERCRDVKLFFLDGAGNAYIELPGFYLFITGKKRTADLLPADRVRMVTPTALKVIFAILCRPQLLAGTYREIAAAARVALGTVGWVMRDLQAGKHVVTLRRNYPALRKLLQAKQHKLLDPERLLREWVAFYAAKLRPKLNVQRFRGPNLDWAEKADLRPYGACWGGEIAAQRMTGYLKPETATVYIQHQPTQLIADYRLRADVRGEIEILDVFWNPDQIPHEPDLVPPILAYADLMATTDARNLEAAKLIHNEHIAPHLYRTT